MKQVIYLSVFFLLLGAACTTSAPEKKEVELTPAEQIQRDSLSRVAQKHQADSMKKLNPLLIMPPDSMYSGDYTDKYEGGITKFKGFFRFGKRHGQWMSFYPNGLVWSEMHYDKGLREGPNMTYYADGKPRYIGFYKNDRKDSTWAFYDSLGILLEKVVYKEDNIVKKIPAK
jgi:MORN repeat protein